MSRWVTLFNGETINDQHPTKTVPSPACLTRRSFVDRSPDWFDHYNSRQTIEAGIKEGKSVFCLHRLKVRSAPAIYLQEQFVIFAANFIRWATRWLTQEALPANNALAPETMGIKQQVKVAAHVSARVIYNFRGRLLKFSDATVFAGKILHLPKARSRHKHCQKSCLFTRFLMKPLLIAQKLR